MIGYKYIRVNNYMWRFHHLAIIPLSMPHVSPDISFIDALTLLYKNNKYFIRWDEGFDDIGENYWWHIVKDKNIEIEDYSGNTRSKIRRGMRNFEIVKVEKEFILEYAYPIYKSIFEKYETFEKPLSSSEFIHSIDGLPSCTEYWGVFIKGSNEFVGFSENIVTNDACFYVSIWLVDKSLKKYSSYALFYIMNKYYIKECGLMYVSDGARSISHNTNIHNFLQSKFGFRKGYSRLRIIYKPSLFLFILFLYPFRNLLANSKYPIAKKISILLHQEEIRRQSSRVAR